MTRSTFKFLLVILAIGLPFAAFIFEPQIQQYVPRFRAAVVLSGILLIAGTTMSIFMRNFGIFIVSLAVAVALPFLINWFVYYWPYVSGHYFG